MNKEIMLCTQIRNSETRLERWWNGLLNIDYPKDKISLDIIEDLSTDNTYDMLKQYQQESPFKAFKLSRPPDFPWFKLRASSRLSECLWCFPEWLAWYNEYWFPMCKNKWFLQIHGDVIAHPQCINRYMKIMKSVPDCGWVGSVGKARGGRELNSWIWRYENPIEVYDTAVDGQDKDVPWFNGNVVRLMTPNELPDKDVFKCAFVGSCFMIRPEVLKFAKMSKWAEEAAAGMAIDMERGRYHAYCDTLAPIIHMNHDGSEEILKDFRKYEGFKLPSLDMLVDVGKNEERCLVCGLYNYRMIDRTVLDSWISHYTIKHPEKYQQMCKMRCK